MPKIGDVIVLTTADHLTKAASDFLREKLASIVADLSVNAKVLVLDGGLDIKVIKTSQLQPIDLDHLANIKVT